ncbi:4-hydroxythreonine-4-phosphate dehydrogenase, partial [Pseudomonas sp. GW247-3R2A]
VKLLSTPEARERADVVIIGDERVLELGMRDAGQRIPYQKIVHLREADHSQAAVPLIDLHNVDPALYERGLVNAESGRLTGETLKIMTDMA